MRIHRVRIDNFRCLRDVEVSFCDASGQPRPLTVLVGPNMSGKTTVLDALHLAYAVAANRDTPRLRPGFNGWAGVAADPGQEICVGLTLSISDDERDSVNRLVRAMDAETPILARAPSHEYAIVFRKPPTQPVPFREDVRALRGREVVRTALALGLAREVEFEHVGGLIYLDQHRSAQLKVPSTDSGPESELRERAGTGDVMPWLELASRLDQKWDTATQGESPWSRVKRLYAELAAPASIDDVVAADQGFDLRLRCGERVYYASGLSSGERQILRLVATLTALRAVRSVVLIDELELHLHPRWQRNLLHFCRHGGGGDNQFIVTTHSSSVLDYVDPADVVNVERIGAALAAA